MDPGNSSHLQSSWSKGEGERKEQSITSPDRARLPQPPYRSSTSLHGAGPSSSSTQAQSTALNAMDLGIGGSLSRRTSSDESSKEEEDEEEDEESENSISQTSEMEIEIN